MLNAIYVMDKWSFEIVYPESLREEIAGLVNVYAPHLTAGEVITSPTVLSRADILISGWGCPVFDKTILDAAPNLRAVFYGAGSIRGLVSEEFWNREITITSAYAANAEPVAEYALSQILFCLKSGWLHASATRREKSFETRYPVHGAYGSIVGIISLGMIGRRVCELLKCFDVSVIAYDPFASEETARGLGVSLCSLDEVFKRAHVVSLHTPDLPETQGMIRGEHFEAMLPYAGFINTARGAIVRENEMIEVLKERPDIQAVLDVTHPEPPASDSPLYELPNVALTPHIAGSMGKECGRMGRYMADELARYVRGEQLCWQITRQMAETLA